MPRFVGETEEAFLVDLENGQPPMPVAKAGLSPDVQAQYRSQVRPVVPDVGPSGLPGDIPLMQASPLPVDENGAPKQTVNTVVPLPSAPSPGAGPVGFVLSSVKGAMPEGAPQVASLPGPSVAPAPRKTSLASEEQAAFAERQKALEAAAKAGEQRAVEEEAAFRERERLLLERAAKEDTVRQEQSAEVAKRMAEVDRLSADLDKPVGQVNPSRWYSSIGTGEKVLAHLSSFLGGFGRGQNEALASIQQAVRDDLTLQQRALDDVRAGKEKRLAAAQTALGTMRSIFADQNAASAAAFGLALDATAVNIERLAKTLSIPERQAQAMDAAAKLRQEAIGAKQQAAQLEFENRVKAGDLAINRAELGLKAMELGAKMGGTGIPDSAVTGQTDPNLLSEEQRKRFVPGEGLALDPDSAKRMRDAAAAKEGVVRKLDELVELRGKGDSSIWSRDKVARAQSISAQALLDLKNLEGTGALDKGTIEIAERILGGDPDRIGQVNPRLQALKTQVLGKYDESRKRLLATRPAASKLSTLRPAD